MSLGQRPDLADAIHEVPSSWPEFMNHDPVAGQFWPRMSTTFPACQLIALDGGMPVARVHAVPFVWAGTDDDLPDRGWDAIFERAFADHAAGSPPNAVSLIEARVAPAYQGRGLSPRLLDAARGNVRALGIGDLFGPVRPTGKAAEPLTPMTEYAARTRADGLPADPWLRVHVRLGARIVKVCPAAMTIPGTLADWRAWTGLPFDTDGDLVVPGGLNPVHVSVEHDHAVYVEPNVWMHHPL